MTLIRSKSLGNVRIFEFSGVLRDVDAVEADESIQSVLRNRKRQPVFLNGSQLESLDKTGLQTLLKTSRIAEKCGFLTTGYIWDLIVQECYAVDQTISPLKNLRESAFFFAKEFALSSEGEKQPLSLERRRYRRLQSILPVELGMDGFLSKKFFAIATNISEGGILVGFIESNSESEILFSMDPLDLQFFNISIWLDPATVVSLKGKLAHSDRNAGTIGFEFYGMEPAIWKVLQQFTQDDKNFKTLEGNYV